MIHVVTDSTSDIPADVCRELDITVVPAHIIFGLQTYEDGINLTREEFYQRLGNEPQLPTTSAPSAGEFVEAYQRLGGEIVSIHLAARLSAIYAAAHSASRMVNNAKVVVFDSTQVSMGIGWQVIAAARAAEQGQSTAQIIERLETLRPRTHVYAVLNTLEYLQQSGRVSWARGLIGHLLKIKPIVEVRDGEVQLTDRVRTRHRSIERLKEKVVALGALESLAVLHTHAQAEAQQLADDFKALLPILHDPIVISEASTVIGSYTGSSALGVAVTTA